MQFDRFSQKQLRVLNWWLPGSSNKKCEGIICDGAVRSGKTMCLSLSFLLWSFASFREKDFAICGKTIKSVYRNLINPLIALIRPLGFAVKVVYSRNVVEVTYGGVTNRFYLFGGKDQGSAGLIQGITLAGVLFDEVALMPKTFVEQALARCSVEGSKFWFSCNPEHPSHWFYLDWIKKITEKNAYYIHFEMKDNPSLSSSMLKRYQSLYSGVFYQRYIKGIWTATYGAVYPMFSAKKHVVEQLPNNLSNFVVSCDYGTVNPSSFGVWGYEKNEQCWYRMREYYHCSRTSGGVKTDEEYCDDLEKLIEGLTIEKVIVDPSAASFMHCIRARGKLVVVTANNNVLDGIRAVSSKLLQGEMKFHVSCESSINEFFLYQWDLSSGKDLPIKKNDHAMDEIRYFVMDKFGAAKDGFYAMAIGRE